MREERVVRGLHGEVRARVVCSGKIYWPGGVLFAASSPVSRSGTAALGLRFPLTQPNHHRHILRIDHIAASREKVVVDRTRGSVGSKAGSNYARARQDSHNHSDEAEARGAIGGAAA